MGHSIDVLLKRISNLRSKLKSHIPRSRYQALQHENKVLKKELAIYKTEIAHLLSQLESESKTKDELLRIVRNRSYRNTNTNQSSLPQKG